MTTCKACVKVPDRLNRSFWRFYLSLILATHYSLFAWSTVRCSRTSVSASNQQNFQFTSCWMNLNEPEWTGWTGEWGRDCRACACGPWLQDQTCSRLSSCHARPSIVVVAAIATWAGKKWSTMMLRDVLLHPFFQQLHSCVDAGACAHVQKQTCLLHNL